MQSRSTRHEHSGPSFRPLLVSFSGIDGAGKTTQIEKLTRCFRHVGFRVWLVAYWDDVAMFRRMRENLGHAILKGDQGVGSPGRPIQRRDKNVQTWYLLPIRIALCFLDALRLRSVWSRIRRKHDADVVIFDRYLYDQLANLDMNNPVVRVCVQTLIRIVAHPDLAYLLDADPPLAYARKPEYPQEFLRCNRENYLALSSLAGLAVIPPGSLQEVESRILWEFARKVGASGLAHSSILTST